MEGFDCILISRLYGGSILPLTHEKIYQFKPPGIVPTVNSTQFQDVEADQITGTAFSSGC